LPLNGQIAAVSCGLTDAGAVLDLDYVEDSAAQADTNFVLTRTGGIVEIQGTAEATPFTEDQFMTLFGLARNGVQMLFSAQDEAVAAAESQTR
jgi:ribonuclease PH